VPFAVGFDLVAAVGAAVEDFVAVVPGVFLVAEVLDAVLAVVAVLASVLVAVAVFVSGFASSFLTCILAALLAVRVCDRSLRPFDVDLFFEADLVLLPSLPLFSNASLSANNFAALNCDDFVS
jgi:hypothetical protein